MKGQIVTTDFMIAFFVFVVVLMGLGVTWANVVNDINDNNIKNDMRRTSIAASNTMTRSLGIPADWNHTNVKIIGLSAGAPNILDSGKVGELLLTDYDTAKSSLKIPYEFYIEMNETNGAVFVIDGNNTLYGIEPNSTSETVVIIRRVFLMDDIPGIMTFRVWK